MSQKGLPPKAMMGNKASVKSSGKLMTTKIDGNKEKSGRPNNWPKKKK